jgi:hypothetical protein
LEVSQGSLREARGEVGVNTRAKEVRNRDVGTGKVGEEGGVFFVKGNRANQRSNQEEAVDPLPILTLETCLKQGRPETMFFQMGVSR